MREGTFLCDASHIHNVLIKLKQTDVGIKFCCHPFENAYVYRLFSFDWNKKNLNTYVFYLQTPCVVSILNYTMFLHMYTVKLCINCVCHGKVIYKLFMSCCFVYSKRWRPGQGATRSDMFTGEYFRIGCPTKLIFDIFSLQHLIRMGYARTV